MGSARISLIRGTSKDYIIDLGDEDGEPIAPALLVGATGEFDMREQATDLTNVLGFTTIANPTRLSFVGSAIKLSFEADDTATLPIKVYTYRVVVTLSNGDRLEAIEWSPFDLNLGGTAAETPPAFDNTVKVDHNLQVEDSLRYMTPGGSPIENAQVRIYFKSDYDAGNLNTPVGVTTTKVDGRWKNPILVLPGFSYVVSFFKPNEYGPDVSTILV